eukprot:2957592-Prymnesium_polylepis.1
MSSRREQSQNIQYAAHGRLRSRLAFLMTRPRPIGNGFRTVIPRAAPRHVQSSASARTARASV